MHMRCRSALHNECIEFTLRNARYKRRAPGGIFVAGCSRYPTTNKFIIFFKWSLDTLMYTHTATQYVVHKRLHIVAYTYVHVRTQVLTALQYTNSKGCDYHTIIGRADNTRCILFGLKIVCFYYKSLVSGVLLLIGCLR